MKKTILTFFSALLMGLLLACSKDDADDTNYVLDQDNSPEYLEGKWKFLRYEIVGSLLHPDLASGLDNYYTENEFLRIKDGFCEVTRGDMTVGRFPYQIKDDCITMKKNCGYDASTNTIQTYPVPYYYLYQYQFGNCHDILVLTLIFLGSEPDGSLPFLWNDVRYIYKRISK